MNRQELIGNVGQSPTIKYLQSGDPVAEFSLATTERWKNKAGDKQERTTWHKIVAFGPVCKVIEKYVSKGQEVFVAGETRHEKWKDKEGNDRTTTKVYLKDLKLLRGGGKSDEDGGNNEDEQPDRGDAGKRAREADSKRARSDADDGPGDFQATDDDIPFSLIAALLLPMMGLLA